eukprot:1144834-Rhodomonas_salina.1
MFATLANYCRPPSLPPPAFPNVFYLDGPDGGSTAALRGAGFESHNLFVANLFPETCATLATPPHNLLETNVFCGRAEVALAETFQSIPFAALYLDG